MTGPADGPDPHGYFATRNTVSESGGNVSATTPSFTVAAPETMDF